MFNQRIPAVTKNLLIINGLFFLATIVFGSRGIDLGSILGAFYPESVNFQPWQIITHMFMHASFPNISHILFNSTKVRLARHSQNLMPFTTNRWRCHLKSLSTIMIPLKPSLLLWSQSVLNTLN